MGVREAPKLMGTDKGGKKPARKQQANRTRTREIRVTDRGLEPAKRSRGRERIMGGGMGKVDGDERHI